MCGGLARSASPNVLSVASLDRSAGRRVARLGAECVSLTTGVDFGPKGVIVKTDNDVAVDVSIGFNGPPPRGSTIAESVIEVGRAGLEVNSLPGVGDELMEWPPGRTRVVVYAPPGDPYARRWVAIRLEPLDAAPPSGEEEPARIERLVAQLGVRPARDAAVNSLRSIGPPARQRLIITLRDHSLTPDARYGAAQALGYIGGAETVEPLLEALADPHPKVRRGAATGFKSLPPSDSDQRVVAALIESLDDHEERIDWLAAMALGRLGAGDTRAIQELVKVAQGTRIDVIDAVLYVLAEVGGASVLPLLERIVSGADERDFGIAECPRRGPPGASLDPPQDAWQQRSLLSRRPSVQAAARDRDLRRQVAQGRGVRLVTLGERPSSGPRARQAQPTASQTPGTEGMPTTTRINTTARATSAMITNRSFLWRPVLDIPLIHPKRRRIARLVGKCTKRVHYSATPYPNAWSAA